MNYKISSDSIEIVVKSKGAELSSLKALNDAYEYLWQGVKPHWERQSPVLFPQIGAAIDGEYIYNGQTYNFPRHGFVRDVLFDCIFESEDKLVFRYMYNEGTMTFYPFEFELLIIYEISDVLKVTYEVINHSTQQMPFSIGGHPGFSWDFNEKADLFFNKSHAHSYTVVSSGIAKGQVEDLTTFSLDTEMFKADTFIYKGIGEVTFKCGTRQVCMDCSEFPYLAIWSQVGAPFVCLEPWYGLPDLMDHDKNILNKEGVVILAPSKKFITSYYLKILS